VYPREPSTAIVFMSTGQRVKLSNVTFIGSMTTWRVDGVVTLLASSPSPEITVPQPQLVDGFELHFYCPEPATLYVYARPVQKRSQT